VNPINCTFDVGRHVTQDIFFTLKMVAALALGTSLCRARLKRDGTRAETGFGLSAKRTSPFKWAVASVQSTAGQPRCAHQR